MWIVDDAAINTDACRKFSIATHKGRTQLEFEWADAKGGAIQCANPDEATSLLAMILSQIVSGQLIFDVNAWKDKRNAKIAAEATRLAEEAEDRAKRETAKV